MDYSQLFILLIYSNKGDREISHLKFKLEQLERAIFGSTSERFVPTVSPDQLDLFNKQESTPDLPDNIEEEEADKESKKKGGKKPKRQKLPASLPRERMTIEPDIDTSAMKVIGEAISEKLEMTPIRFYVHQIVRPKYIDLQGNIHIGELPNDAFAKRMYGPTVLANVAVNKYVNHQPLYRQSKMFGRDGLEMSRSTLNDLIRFGFKLLKPLEAVLIKKILLSNYLQADESSIRVLTKDKESGSIKGCMLAMTAPSDSLVGFKYIKTKEKANILGVLKGFQGHLQVDGNVSYEGMKGVLGVVLMHCLVHSRRKFDQALEYDNETASHVLSEIQKIFMVERKAKEDDLTAEQIYHLRQEKALPIWEELKIYLDDLAPKLIPSTPIYVAVRYMLKRWPGLTSYITDAKLRPDNNLIENQIRPLALGRKNYMFAANHQGAEYAALYYSLFGTCLLNGINPLKWLVDVLKRINDHPVNKLEELLPTKDYIFLDVE